MNEQITESFGFKATARPRRYGFLAVLTLLQILFLIGLALSYYAIGWFGKEVRLQTVPMKLQDMVYHNSITLNYQINQLNTNLWKGAGIAPTEKDRVYVLLKPTAHQAKPVYEAIGVYDKKPAVQTGEVALTARIDYSFEQQMHLVYGLENYDVSQSTAAEIAKTSGPITVLIKAAPWGKAIVTGLSFSE